MAFSNGNGSYAITNLPITNFATWAANPGARIVTGDFNGDRRTDLALVGVVGWTTMPMAFSNGNGTFTVTNTPSANFAAWATTPGVRVVTGDFNGDKRADLALTGVGAWTTVPTALSAGNGAFTVTNPQLPTFAGLTGTPGAKIVTGDFNGDSRADIAVTGSVGSTTVSIALASGDGTYGGTNSGAGSFPQLAGVPGAKLVVGDLNADGRADLALTGVSGWATLPTAISLGDGSFTVTNNAAPGGFADLAATPDVTVVAGDYNADGRTDLALIGPYAWGSVPIAFSAGDGGYTVTNNPISIFAGWATAPGVTITGTPIGALF
jgi:hypothetical protein